MTSQQHGKACVFHAILLKLWSITLTITIDCFIVAGVMRYEYMAYQQTSNLRQGAPCHQIYIRIIWHGFDKEHNTLGNHIMVCMKVTLLSYWDSIQPRVARHRTAPQQQVARQQQRAGVALTCTRQPVCLRRLQHVSPIRDLVSSLCT